MASGNKSSLLMVVMRTKSRLGGTDAAGVSHVEKEKRHFFDHIQGKRTDGREREREKCRDYEYVGKESLQYPVGEAVPNQG